MTFEQIMEQAHQFAARHGDNHRDWIAIAGYLGGKLEDCLAENKRLKAELEEARK